MKRWCQEFWTNGDGVKMSKNWTKQPRPHLSKRGGRGGGLERKEQRREGKRQKNGSEKGRKGDKKKNGW